jgi:hypothetical protein
MHVYDSKNFKSLGNAGVIIWLLSEKAFLEEVDFLKAVNFKVL